MKNLAHFLRRLMPRSFRRLTYRAGQFFGDEFRPQDNFGGDVFPSVQGALGYLKEWGFSPALIIDVGAFRGEWARMVKGVYPGASIVMVEAQEGCEPNLQTVCTYFEGVDYRISLLGPEDGKVVEFTEMLTGSSVFEERSGVARKKSTKTTTTLDTLLSGVRPSLIKLDVQGYELEVLKGAREVLRDCEFVLMEASLIPINQGCPLIGEVVAFMGQANFRLLDFCSQIRRKDKALWQTDLLFINNNSSLLPAAQLTAVNW